MGNQEIMFTFAQIVSEDHIRRAIKEGAFDNLEGMGKPLPPDETVNMPPEMRMAYRILKNAGYVSSGTREKVEDRGDAVSTPELFDELSDEQIKYRQIRKLKAVSSKAGRSLGFDEDSEYYARIVGSVKLPDTEKP